MTFRKDDNGNIVKADFVSPALTDAQKQAKAINASALQVDPIKAMNIVNTAKGNLNSPGVITSLANLGVDPKSALAQNIKGIDALTKDQRTANQNAEALKRAKEDFNKTPQGRIWSAVKGLSRGVFTAGQAPFELANALYRQTAQDINQRGIIGGLARPWVGGVQDTKDYFANVQNQTKIGQIINQAIQKKSLRFELGEGFFASEDTGLGKAAREASNATAKVPVKDSNGKIVAYRPRSLFSDIPSYSITLGHPDSRVGGILGFLGDFIASYYLDFGTIAGKAAKIAKATEESARTAKGIKEAAKISDQVAAQKQAQADFKASHDAFMAADSAYAKTTKNVAEAKRAEAMDAASGRREDLINATDAVKKQGQKYQDSLTRNQSIRDTVDSITKDINDAAGVVKAPARLTRAQSELRKAETALKEGQAAAATGKYPTWMTDVPKLEAAVQAASEKVNQLQDIVTSAKVIEPGKIDELKASLNEAKLRLKYSDQEVKQMERELNISKKNARASKQAFSKSMEDYSIRLGKSRAAQDIINDATLTREQKMKALSDAFVKLSETKKIDTTDVDFDALANFLTNGHGSAAISKLVDAKDWKEIFRIGKGRITVEQAQEIASATSKEEVMQKLAPFMSDSSVAMGVFKPGFIEKTGAMIAPRMQMAAPFARALTGAGATVAKHMPFHAQLAAIANAAVDGVKIQKKFVFDPIKRSYQTKVRGGTLLNIHDTDALVEFADDFMKALKLEPKVADKLLDEIANAKSASDAGFTASVKVLKAVRDQYGQAIPKHMQEKFDRITTAFISSNNKARSWWATRHIEGAEIGYIQNGNEKMVLSGPHLESELLNSTVYMPPAGEVLRFMNKVQKYSVSGKLADISDSLVNDYWKRIQLVRPAYIIRNIAEEQLRVFGTGHISFFNSPMMAMAMWMGAKDGNAMRRVMYRMDNYTHDITGRDFTTGNPADDLLNETTAHDAVNSYVDIMGNQSWSQDERALKTLTINNVGPVGVNHERFYDGVANRIRILNNSEFARVVAGWNPAEVKAAVASGISREEAVLDYFSIGSGRKSLEKFAEVQNETVRNWLYSREGLRQYLYTGRATIQGVTKDVGVLAEVMEITAGNRNLRELIAFGKTRVGNAEILVPTPAMTAKNSLLNAQNLREGKKALLEEQKLFAKTLDATFRGVAKHDPTTLVNIPNAITDAIIDKKSAADYANLFTDWFFDIATTLENNATRGPEFRQAYWDAIQRIAGALNKDAADKLKLLAKDSLSPLRKNGKNIGNSHPVWKALDNVSEDGVLSLDDAHKYADAYARNHVKELFYSAQERRLLFHQLRLVGPFMNAWDDTLRKWGQIGVENPFQVYKLGRAINWMEKPESSAMYALTDAKDYYDPNQGFFFTDPRSGQRMFWVPFSGTILAKLAGVPTQANYAGSPIAYAANPMSFNFALGAGSILPGVGPGLTLPLTALDSMTGGFLDRLPQPIYNWLFPFGKVDLSRGPASFILSSNWNRILGGAWGDDSMYANTYRPIMEYIASGGNYNLDDPTDQAELVQKTGTFASFFSVMRGVVGLFSPAALTTQALAKDTNGDATTQFAIYNDFATMLEANGGDYNLAVHDLLDLYGANAVFAIISGTSGKGASNWDAYQFVTENPDVATKYPDVWAYVYPGGGFSQEMYKWNMLHDKKKQLSPQEVLDKANSLRYYAAKDSILKLVDAGYLDNQGYKNALQNLKDAHNGGPKGSFDPNAFPREMTQMRELVKDERFTELPTIQALRDYIGMRDAIMNKYGKNPNAQLQGTSGEVKAIRTWLSSQLNWLLNKDTAPDFYKMYYEFFAKELEG